MKPHPGYEITLFIISNDTFTLIFIFRVTVDRLFHGLANINISGEKKAQALYYMILRMKIIVIQ